MFSLPNIKNIVIASGLGLMIGFAAGYYTKGEFVKADQLDAATEARHRTAQGIQGSLTQSLAVEAKVAASSTNQAVISKAAVKRVQRQEKTNEALFVPQCPVWSFDVGTARLLNDARAGTTPDPTVERDAESEEAPAISPAEFVQNDLEVVALYHELAVRHDALVDWVLELIKQQAEK